jgi:hypothetical protein
VIFLSPAVVSVPSLRIFSFPVEAVSGHAVYRRTVEWFMNDRFERISKQVVDVLVQLLSGRIEETPSQVSPCPGRDSNRALAEYET